MVLLIVELLLRAARPLGAFCFGGGAIVSACTVALGDVTNLESTSMQRGENMA